MIKENIVHADCYKSHGVSDVDGFIHRGNHNMHFAGRHNRINGIKFLEPLGTAYAVRTRLY